VIGIAHRKRASPVRRPAPVDDPARDATRDRGVSSRDAADRAATGPATDPATTGAATEAATDPPTTGAAADATRPPSAWTVIPSAPNVATTVPSRSVRRTRAPAAARRASVAAAGWPYGLPAPADATATVGWTVSTNASVVAVRLP
jgi:hypothetical protein